MYGFFIPTFIALSVFLVIILIITGIIAKKLYPLMYCIAVFSYVNTVTYLIDSYELRKNLVVLILAVSAVLMMLFGYLVAKKSNFKDKKLMAKKKKFYFFGIIIPSTLLIIFAVISMFNIGLSVEKNPVSFIESSDLFYDCSYDYSKPDISVRKQKSIEIMNITIKNDFFLPRRVTFDNYLVCSEPNNYYYFSLDFYDEDASYNNFRGAVEINAFSSKTVSVSVLSYCGDENSTISKLYLIESEDPAKTYQIDCRHLSKKQKDGAIVIEVK